MVRRSAGVCDVVVTVVLVVAGLCDPLLLVQVVATVESVLFLPGEHHVQDVMRRRSGRLQFGQHLHQLASVPPHRTNQNKRSRQ